MEIQPKDTSRGHFYVSLVKSVLRITAGGALISGFIVHAGILLIVAEVLGIVEELVSWDFVNQLTILMFIIKFIWLV